MQKWVDNYKYLYAPVEDGTIYSTLQCKSLKGTLTPYGYYSINLRNSNGFKTHLVHRLIAKAFIPNPDNKRTVNHINGIKTDNRIENLEWMTYSENHLHAYRVLGRKKSFGVRKKRAVVHNK